MPLYLIERQFAEQLQLSPDSVKSVDEINEQEGVRWVVSFLSADRLKSYCLYEATSPDAIWAAAQEAGLPADVIVEVDEFDPASMR
ncbi:MAG TPA: DUF4242 domain-containing protein [Solirubrobacteraceae bacterium]|nr:DUF4242 domain-containing protein [Solirubrobacteraceae bacterium]